MSRRPQVAAKKAGNVTNTANTSNIAKAANAANMTKATTTSNARFGDDGIIKLESGFAKIDAEGIQPFIQFVEVSDKEFFKSKGFVDLYDIIFKMCIQRDPDNWSEHLYQKYVDSLRNYIQQKVLSKLRAVRHGHADRPFLCEWAQRWKNFKLVVKGLSRLFMYLDRFYTDSTDNVLPLRPQAFKLYSDTVFTEMGTPVRNAVLRCIERERQGEEQDRPLLQQCLQAFIEIGFLYADRKLKVYKEEFEKKMVEESGAFYKQRASGWKDQDSCPAYMERVETIIGAERQRVDAYMNRSSLQPLIAECYRHLLQAHQADILRKQTGLSWLLATDSLPDIARIYRLYSMGQTYANATSASATATASVSASSASASTASATVAAASAASASATAGGVVSQDNNPDMVIISEIFYEYTLRAGNDLIDRCQEKTSNNNSNNNNDVEEEDKKSEDCEMKEANGDEEKTLSATMTTTTTTTTTRPLVVGSDKNHTLVNSLLDLHTRSNLVVGSCFGGVHLFQLALKRAFEGFVNKDDRVAKQLAKFAGDALAKGSKLCVTSLEGTLDGVVFLYGYIQEKDVFEHDYQLFLANRLLMGLCESEHAEKSMISRLKRQCGYSWTNKLEGMFKDVNLSKEMMSRFLKMHDAKISAAATAAATATAATAAVGNNDTAIEVNVCTTGCWPSAKMTPYKMPEDIAKMADRFKRFYLAQNSGHKLEWRMDMGQAEVVVDFSPRMRRSLVVNTPQMIILLAFNDQKIISCGQLLDITGFSIADITNPLLSLAHPKISILLKRPNTKHLELSHQFMINAKFVSQLRKVIVPLLRTSVRDPEDRKSVAAIELQRRHMIDACVVRIMKARKKLRFNVLVSEVVTQLQARFSPKPHDIKKRIEALVETEYLKRADEDRNVFEYLA